MKVTHFALAEDIKAYERVADQRRAKLAAKERTQESARQFADYCRKLDGAFETVSIPFEKKREMLTILRVNVLAHSLERHVEVTDKSRGDSLSPLKSKV